MSKPLLMAITLHRPWPYAMVSLGKNLENRTWNCPLPPGSWIAIHAGKKYDRQGADWIRQELSLGCPGKAEHPTGIVAIARFECNVTTHNSLWFAGPIGWEFSRVIAVPVLECAGKQGLWQVPAVLLPKLRAAWRNAMEVKAA